MRWTKGTRSSHLEDRRFSRGGRGRTASVGIGGILVVLIGLFFGKDFTYLLSGPSSGGDGSRGAFSSQPEPGTVPANDPNAELVDFVSFVLDDIQGTWQKIFPAQLGRDYEAAKLVLFSDAIDSACGYSTAAIGPFYCPADAKAYIDLSFYKDLHRRFGAPGDFAQAYVIAHEIGHHVQSLLGTSAEVHRRSRSLPEAEANELSVRLELQADCYAGLWAHSTQKRNILESGDVEEGLGAASAIGDDRLQKMATGKVMPETFTHGSSAQRMRWFERGLRSGQIAACDTFGAQSL